MKQIVTLIAIALIACPKQNMHAQFLVDGQIVQRSELRHGAGKLLGDDEDPAAFIAQRLRLQAKYSMEGFTFYGSIQDVRTWGNTPQVKPSDPYLSIHEAWAETKLGDFWMIKLGRQELNYDNARFLGNLDWALQGRAHDFALVKYEKETAKLHFGGGFNQDDQALSGNTFTTSNQYKNAQMIRAEKQWDNTQLSLLAWNEGRQFIGRDSIGNITSKKVFYGQTIGLPTVKYTIGQTIFSGFYYHQLGKDQAGRSTNAFDVSVQVTHTLKENADKGRSIALTSGFEILSGTDSDQTNKSNSFNPLYGTNHAHNGYMDLFFVGGRFVNSVGLKDFFLKTKYRISARTFAQLDAHVFHSQADIKEATTGNALDAYLGSEIDLTLGYNLNNAVSFQSGFSQIFASGTLENLQKKLAYKDSQYWAYIMFVYRPTMKNKFIGILF